MLWIVWWGYFWLTILKCWVGGGCTGKEESIRCARGFKNKKVYLEEGPLLGI